MRTAVRPFGEDDVVASGMGDAALIDMPPDRPFAWVFTPALGASVDGSRAQESAALSLLEPVEDRPAPGGECEWGAGREVCVPWGVCVACGVLCPEADGSPCEEGACPISRSWRRLNNDPPPDSPCATTHDVFQAAVNARVAKTRTIAIRRMSVS